MRSLIASMIFGAVLGLGCTFIEDTSDRLDASEAESVCHASCDRQGECDDQFDVAACKSKCDASVAAWYLCPDAPAIADYIEMCNELACEEVASCLEQRPEC